MFEALRRLWERRISAREFERNVFTAVTRRITDKDTVRRELEAAWNLPALASSDERRENLAAHYYLALEDHVANGQATKRIPKEVLREHIFRHCHPERAEGMFRLIFLTRYGRQMELAERFADTLFARARVLVSAEASTAIERDVLAAGKGRVVMRNGAFVWRVLERSVRDLDAGEQVTAIQTFLKEAVGILVRHLTAAIESVRAELLLQEVYHELRNRLDYLEDVPTMLRIIPDEFLAEERVGLMEKRELEHELRRRSDELEMTLTTLREEQGKLSALSREELEARVAERTAELVKALEDVKAGRAQLEEFSSLATHELRTPAGIIKGYATLLLDGAGGKLSDAQKKFIAHIKEANERLLDLVNAMLNASRIELGTLAIEPESIYLPDLADAVISELSPQIEAKRLKLMRQYDRKIPIVEVDPRLMRAVLQNLLSNAVKYTPEGGGISLGLEKRGTDILLEVIDTGFGIPEKEQAKMFSKMFRADNVRARHIEGTGLGLYIVKSVVEQAGGKIWFESPAPTGKLPRKAGAVKASAGAETGMPGAAFYVTIPLSGMKRKEGIRGLS